MDKQEWIDKIEEILALGMLVDDSGATYKYSNNLPEAIYDLMEQFNYEYWL